MSWRWHLNVQQQHLCVDSTHNVWFIKKKDVKVACFHSHCSRASRTISLGKVGSLPQLTEFKQTRVEPPSPRSSHSTWGSLTAVEMGDVEARVAHAVLGFLHELAFHLRIPRSEQICIQLFKSHCNNTTMRVHLNSRRWKSYNKQIKLRFILAMDKLNNRQSVRPGLSYFSGFVPTLALILVTTLKHCYSVV